MNKLTLAVAASLLALGTTACKQQPAAQNDDPAAAPVQDLEPSPALRIVGNMKDTLAGRVVGILIADGSEGTQIAEVKRLVTGFTPGTRPAERWRELATRKLVERAKSLLTTKMGLTEPEAFRWIQKTSMDRRLSMREVAEAIINQVA